eukprot:CAMPEP_0202875410 /NCGR_PEP_ID=MMETSP1391-20130828/27250_1 /ASSEMBLY_ACC=CAM_ASM_000867 /TAXON_ID=1034604 /ORGANISM="Chlamydomonas leiostraca, Strain SAG 11-49" /LENGTH=57 /DNA_ID=CAMNT_0049557083 /DNA_START=569 /DNA_END=740 /DNA_ORIENTATION=+
MIAMSTTTASLYCPDCSAAIHAHPPSDLWLLAARAEPARARTRAQPRPHAQPYGKAH